MGAAFPAKNRAYWIDYMLENWAEWMHGPESPEGLPKEASGGARNATSMDWESCEGAYERLDAKLAETTNAAIEDLETLQQIAIYRAYDVIAVFRHRSEVAYGDALAAAKESVGSALERRGVWLGG